MRSAKSEPNLWQIWQVFGPWARPHGTNGQMTMKVHNYRPRRFHRTSNGENPSNSYRDMGSASLAAARPPARTVTTIPLQPEGLRGEKGPVTFNQPWTKRATFYINFKYLPLNPMTVRPLVRSPSNRHKIMASVCNALDIPCGPTQLNQSRGSPVFFKGIELLGARGLLSKLDIYVRRFIHLSRSIYGWVSARKTNALALRLSYTNPSICLGQLALQALLVLDVCQEIWNIFIL